VGVRGILLDGLRRTNDFGIGIESLAGGAGVVVVHIGGDLHADMAGSDDAGNDGFDALAQAIFQIGGVLFLIGGRCVGAGLVVAAREQGAVIVNDGHAVRQEARN